MTGNRSVICAEGRFLVGETGSIDLNTPLIAPSLQLHLFHSGKGTCEKAHKRLDASNHSRDRKPHILWRGWFGTTSNCVILHL